MRTHTTLVKNTCRIKSFTAHSELSDEQYSLLECMEQTYKALDLSEPVWVGKHARELAGFSRTKFFPGDFLEPVNFDWCEVEVVRG